MRACTLPAIPGKVPCADARPRTARSWIQRLALRVPALLLLAGSAQAQLAPGDVDPGFVYPQPTLREPDSTNAVGLPSGFMIVKSREAQPPSTESTLALTLIDQDGHVIDFGFGTDGTYTNRVPGAVNVATAAVRLSSGAFVLGGFKRVEGSTVDSVAAVAKVDGTGALDPAFGDDGIAAFDVQGKNDRVGAVSELPDGRIAALVWSRHYADPYGDCDVTWMVLVLLSPDGQHADVADARLRDSWTGGCRDSFTMATGPGGVVLHGNELNVFEGSAAVFPVNWRYGPFAYDDDLGLVSTTIDGSRIGIVLPAARPPGNLYPSLGTLAGFDDEQVTYSKLVLDLPHERFYLGLSSDGGRVAIARFRLDGSLDTGWGRGGAVVVQEAGQSGVWLSGGLATDLRLLAVQQDGSVVVVTADGIVRRLAGGNGVAHGVFKLDTDYFSVTEGDGYVPILVHRVDGASGAVTVDLVIGYCASASTGACAGQPDAATPGEDFVATRVTLEYPDGNSSPRRVDLKLLDDSRKEPTEVIRVKLANPTGGAGILGADAWVYVQDNDGGSTGAPSPGPDPVGHRSGGGLVGAPLLMLLALALVLRRYRMRPGLRSDVIVRNGT